MKGGLGQLRADDWLWPPLLGTAPEERKKIKSDSAQVRAKPILSAAPLGASTQPIDLHVSFRHR